MADKIPQNWPASLVYLRQPVFSKAIDKSTTSRLSSGKPLKTAVSVTKIKMIESASHPANGQHGLFAAIDLAPNSFILDYVGFYHLPTPEDSDASSDYDLSLRHDDLYLGIDAAKMGNEARMINDYRGVKEAANARFDSYVNEDGEVKMGVFAMGSGKKGGKGIKKGEEICVSYGKGYWKERNGDAMASQTAIVEEQ